MMCDGRVNIQMIYSGIFRKMFMDIWMKAGARKSGDIKVARTPWHTHLILWQHSSFHNCELTEFEWNRVPDCMPWINNKKCPCPCSIASQAANQKYQINKLHTLLITIAFQQFSGGLRYKYTMYAAHSFSFPILCTVWSWDCSFFFPALHGNRNGKTLYSSTYNIQIIKR